MATKADRPPPPRIGLTVDEAAQSLGMSRSHFCRHVLPNIRIVYTGEVRTVPVAELEKFADKHARQPRLSA